MTTTSTPRAAALLGSALGVLLVTCTVLLSISGASWVAAAVQALVITVQAAAGMVLWMLIRGGSTTVIEQIGMGLALGTFTCLVAGVLLQPVTMWGWLAPAIAAAVLAAIALPRRRVTIRFDRGESVGAFISLGAALVLLAWFVMRSPLPTDRLTDSVHPDLPFFETLMRGLANFGPADNLLMSQTQIRYHWLSYAWAGQVDLASHAPTFQVLTRTAPLVGCIALACLAVAWGRRLSTVRWVPTLAGLLVIMSGFVGARFGVLTNLDSPSALFSLMWLMALCVALFAYVSRESGPWTLVALLALGGAATGGKVSAGLIAVLGVGLVALVALIRRESFARRALLAAVAVGVGAAVTYLLLIAGVDVAGNIGVGSADEKAAVFQGLLPFSGPLGVLLGTAVLVLATLPRLAGLVPIALDRQWRWRPEAVFSIGTVVASALALFVLSEGVNDLWFIIAASGPACVVAAAGVGNVAGSPLPTRGGRDARLIVAAASTVLVVLAVAVARTADPHQGVRVWGLPLIVSGMALLIGFTAATRTTVRPLAMPFLALAVVALTTTGLLGRAFEFTDGSSTPPTWPTAEIVTPAPIATEATVQPTEDSTTTAEANGADTADPADVWAAGTWVADNIPVHDIIATDHPDSLDLTSLSGHRAFLAGARYQVGLGAASSAAEVPVRFAISSGLDSGPSDESLAALCAAGVSWLWLENPAAAETWAGTAEQVFANASIAVLALDPAACPAT